MVTATLCGVTKKIIPCTICGKPGAIAVTDLIHNIPALPGIVVPLHDHVAHAILSYCKHHCECLFRAYRMSICHSASLCALVQCVYDEYVRTQEGEHDE